MEYVSRCQIIGKTITALKRGPDRTTAGIGGYDTILILENEIAIRLDAAVRAEGPRIPKAVFGSETWTDVETPHISECIGHIVTDVVGILNLFCVGLLLSSGYLVCYRDIAPYTMGVSVVPAAMYSGELVSIFLL